MAELLELWNVLGRYPTVVPFGLLSVCLIILVFSIFTVGLDSDVELPAEIGGIDNPLVTAGLSKIPLFLGLTLTFFPMTAFSILIDNLLLGYLHSFLDVFGFIGNIVFYTITTVVLIVLFFVSLYVAKFLSTPIEKALDKTKFTLDFVGKDGVVSSGTATHVYGEIRLFVEHREYLLNVLTEEGVVLKSGDKVIIQSYDEKIDKYLVIPA